MKQTLLTILVLVASTTYAVAQNTVGLISYDPAKSYDGYNLFFPHNQTNVYLMNNCGQIVHTWVDSVYKPGNTVYLQENGDLIRCGGRGAGSNGHIHAGGGGELVERRSWDNQLLWRFYYNDSTKRMHHDIAPMPNGNILILAWEMKSNQEAIDAGRDTSLLSEKELWPEHILELKPIGKDSAEIVWQWHIWDHLIQDHDSTKQNYGNVAAHPELIDLNYDNNQGKADWLHANSIDYNANLDQIMLSIPTFDEIWIIDHSTSIQEAASHMGGNSGKGGDLIFRWGNPAASKIGTAADRKLFYQHDAHWIDHHLKSGDPDYGKIAVFNNRVGGKYSSINIINAPFDSYSNEYLINQGKYLPQNFEWTFAHPDTSGTYTTGLAGWQRLKNGNALVCTGFQGYTYEVTPNNEIVWEYETPLSGGNPVAQGTSLNPRENLTFRMYRYPTNYAAFTNRDLSPKSYLELNPDTIDACKKATSVTESMALNQNFKLYPNPAYSEFTVDLNEQNDVLLSVKNGTGKMVYQERLNKQQNRINTTNWQNGIYWIQIDNNTPQKLIVIQ